MVVSIRTLSTRSHSPVRSGLPQVMVLYSASLRDVPHQAIISVLMHRVALSNDQETVSHEKLVVGRSSQSGWDVDKNSNGSIAHVGKGFSSVEDGGDNAGSQITGQVRGNGHVGETPDHAGVG